MAGQAGFFDLDERYAGLSANGDPLERLSGVVDFEVFREELERALKRSERRRGGRPPMDAVMMFKVLVLQALWGLFVRTVGLARARVKIGMVNLAYNMRRLIWLDAQYAAA